jgi:uncharacterized membrane protein YfcA
LRPASLFCQQASGILSHVNSDPISLILGAGAAFFVGLAKTGMPGGAIPAVAMMAQAFPDDTKLSVGALLPILIVGDLFAVAWYRRHAQWSRLWHLLPYVAAGMVPGYLVLAWIDTGGLRVLLGLLVLILLVLEIWRRRLGWLELPRRWWFTAVAGILAGFGTTVGNAAGPVMSIYLLSHGLQKQEFVGTAAWFFFLVNVSKVPLFWGLGMITTGTMGFGLVILPMVAVGAFGGLYLLRWIPQKAFDLIVLALAGLAAVHMVLG